MTTEREAKSGGFVDTMSFKETKNQTATWDACHIIVTIEVNGCCDLKPLQAPVNIEIRSCLSEQKQQSKMVSR